jgi:hypothetical protein
MTHDAHLFERRRRLLKLTGGGLLMIPVINLIGCAEETAPKAQPTVQSTQPPAPAPTASQPAQPAAAKATALTRLDESASSTQALGYKHAAADVDTAAYPRFEAGQLCSNCTLYTTDDSSEAGWGACSIFPGKLVNGQGWCNVYQRRA